MERGRMRKILLGGGLGVSVTCWGFIIWIEPVKVLKESPTKLGRFTLACRARGRGKHVEAFRKLAS